MSDAPPYRSVHAICSTGVGEHQDGGISNGVFGACLMKPRGSTTVHTSRASGYNSWTNRQDINFPAYHVSSLDFSLGYARDDHVCSRSIAGHCACLDPTTSTTYTFHVLPKASTVIAITFALVHGVAAITFWNLILPDSTKSIANDINGIPRHSKHLRHTASRLSQVSYHTKLRSSTEAVRAINPLPSPNMPTTIEPRQPRLMLLTLWLENERGDCRSSFNFFLDSFSETLLSLAKLRQLPSIDRRVQLEWFDIRAEVALSALRGIRNCRMNLRRAASSLSSVLGWIASSEGTHVGVGIHFLAAVGINFFIYYCPTLFETLGCDYNMRLIMSGSRETTTEDRNGYTKGSLEATLRLQSRSVDRATAPCPETPDSTYMSTYPFPIKQYAAFGETTPGDCDRSEFKIENGMLSNMSRFVNASTVAVMLCSEAAGGCDGITIVENLSGTANAAKPDAYRCLCSNVANPIGFVRTGRVTSNPGGN
ncbi:hypothetical protein AC579_8102 [Pseudocercospora musae]|uniref:Uncharacterized protein n=1 Tax=Pseudocercospora musae TaxID=113226 RepID=A0A139H570_9PEZI|nr:hypothetical protein AC579_8102 [Pseudocercospora musae]